MSAKRNALNMHHLRVRRRHETSGVHEISWRSQMSPAAREFWRIARDPQRGSPAHGPHLRDSARKARPCALKV